MRLFVLVSSGVLAVANADADEAGDGEMASSVIAEADAICAASRGRGHFCVIREFRAEAPDNDLLLDDILEAQPDIVLLAGVVRLAGHAGPAGSAAQEETITQLAGVVWKFDSTCRVALLGGTSTVAGIETVPSGSPQAALAALLGEHPPDQSGAVRPTRREGVSATAALLVSRGWAAGDLAYLSADEAAQVCAAIERSDLGGLTIIDPDGCRRAVGVPLHAPCLVRLLDDPRLGTLVAQAMGRADVWLGAVEGLSGQTHQWRRQLLTILLAAGAPEFRPGLSVLICLEPGGGQMHVRPGTHRLHAPVLSESAAADQVLLSLGQAVLVEAGCAFRVLHGRFLHLRFILGWMKPDILLATALPGLLGEAGAQARQWCGADIGMPSSVQEFLDVEEATLAGGFAQRKGSGI